MHVPVLLLEEVTFMNSQELFYHQFSKDELHRNEFRARKFSFYSFFWTHAKSNVCSSVHYFDSNYKKEQEHMNFNVTTATTMLSLQSQESQSHSQPQLPYTVIHSRWMKPLDPNCPTRLKKIADREWTKRQVRLDRSAPCDLPPVYVHSILRQMVCWMSWRMLGRGVMGSRAWVETPILAMLLILLLTVIKIVCRWIQILLRI